MLKFYARGGLKFYQAAEKGAGVEASYLGIHSGKRLRQDTETLEATSTPTAGQSVPISEPKITQARLQGVTAAYLPRFTSKCCVFVIINLLDLAQH